MLPSGNKGHNPALKNTPLKENTPLATETLYTDIGTQPDHPPLIAATGMLLLETNHISQSYLHHHFYCPKEAFYTVIR